MKTALSRLALVAFLVPFFSIVLVAQQHSDGKKVVITKHSVDSDGSETTETIVKKGKAAEDFDAEKYLRENKTASTDVDIRIESGNGNVSFFDYESDDERQHERSAHGQNWNFNWDNGSNGGLAWTSCGDNDQHGFLGVEEDADEDDDAEGLTVEVVRNSAAAKAGLKTNDIILKLNDTQTDDWDALSDFMAATKPGDKIKVTYRRDGRTQTTEATLTKHSEVTKLNCESKAKRGFLGVSDMGDDDSDAPGIKVSITHNSGAEKAGLKTGDVILKLNDAEIRDWEDLSDVLNESAPGDKMRVSYRRDGKTETTEATLGEQKDAWSGNYNFEFKGLEEGLENLGNDLEKGIGNLDFSTFTREKEACLGVYSGSWRNGSDATGSKISGFTDESAARDASMQVGDVITAINGQAVTSHDELWNEIAKFKPGEKVSVAYLREGQATTVEATLKTCKDRSSIISLPDNLRQFRTWNWENGDNERFRQRQIITIRKSEGDAPKVNTAPPSGQSATDRNLNLTAFRAFPNPTQGQVTIEFRGEAVPTVVNLLDMSGRQLFHEELNGFDGNYSQQFDLTAYAKGTIIVQVLQGERVFSEQIVVN